MTMLTSQLAVQVRRMAGQSPRFDPVTRGFLRRSWKDFQAQCSGDSLVQGINLSADSCDETPWLFLLRFATHGLARPLSGGEVVPVTNHDVAVRFPADFLRSANSFECLRLLAPVHPPAFHSSIEPRTGAICIELYPGESLLEIAQSLHSLFSWRIHQFDEHDALNSAACVWGRAHFAKPFDDRPLFGPPPNIQVESIRPNAKGGQR